MATEESGKLRVLYLSHGGGPLPLLGDKSHDEMVIALKRVAALIPKPSAIIVVSAHWETVTPTITHGSTPEPIYDYYGFPDESYEITYPAPGYPALADEVHWGLRQQGITSILDDDRGFDHGLFVPLKIMYPDADTPCIQLSLVKGLDPAKHIAMGKALASLTRDNILVVGSGFSFHNMKAFFTPSQERTEKNDAFKHWLVKTCSDPELIESERAERLINWEHAPYARYCHPRAEHLLPLHVCYGATGRACDSVYEAEILGIDSAMFLWS